MPFQHRQGQQGANTGEDAALPNIPTSSLPNNCNWLLKTPLISKFLVIIGPFGMPFMTGGHLGLAQPQRAEALAEDRSDIERGGIAQIIVCAARR